MFPVGQSVHLDIKKDYEEIDMKKGKTHLERILLIEGLGAELAGKGTLTGMDPHVSKHCTIPELVCKHLSISFF
jgi:hypothetical protein